MTLSEIWIYPVKSLGGIRLTEGQVEEKGLRYDRRWMVVDENDVFITQRKFPKMALLDIVLQEHGFVISYRPEPANQLFVPYQPVDEKTLTVKVWDDLVTAVTVGAEADRWLSDQLELSVKLVYMPDSTERKVDPRYAFNGENVGFADDFPFLLISQASLDELNSRLEEPISMQRFRPNFVVTGTEPFAEDDWKEIRIGDLLFNIVKPCARCVLTTVDPETGQGGKEPLKTLATYRKANNKILFGQNVTSGSRGVVKQHDPVSVIA